MKYLIEYDGANINRSNKLGSTPLTIACERGSFDIVKYLIENCGTSVHHSTNVSDTTLTRVCEKSKSFDIVKYLVENCGANYNHTTKPGDSTLARPYRIYNVRKFYFSEIYGGEYRC